MKADLTRNTFHGYKHFARVVMQQGRVQLDADWNEQTAILLRYLRAFAADSIGPHGGPGPNPGFQIAGIPSTGRDFTIGAGRYYVQGIPLDVEGPAYPVVSVGDAGTNQVQVSTAVQGGVRLQVNGYVSYPDGQGGMVIAKIVKIGAAGLLTLDQDTSPLKGATNPALQGLVTYLTQPDYPVPANAQLPANTNCQVYVDVWERLITYVEDDSVREAALGGPDTAARTKVVWQVKQTAPCSTTIPIACCTAEAITSQFQPPNRGLLKAVAKQKGVSTDPCVINPDANYRGPENQLYRIEIHTGAVDGNGNTVNPTFKWSRENGSVVFPIVNIGSGGGMTTVTLESLGRDDRFGLNEGDWVELQDDDYVLQNRAEALLQVQSIDSTSLTVTLTGALSSQVGQDQTKHPLLRRWDETAGDATEGGLQLGADNAVLLVEGTGNQNWLTLEDGIQIQFQPALAGTTNQYRTSDYWLIPARTATGDIEWPTVTSKDVQGNVVTDPVPLPPDGVTHYYAPLAVIAVDGPDPVSLRTECRWQFPQEAVPMAPLVPKKK